MEFYVFPATCTLTTAPSEQRFFIHLYGREKRGRDIGMAFLPVGGRFLLKQIPGLDVAQTRQLSPGGIYANRREMECLCW